MASGTNDLADKAVAELNDYMAASFSNDPDFGSIQDFVCAALKRRTGDDLERIAGTSITVRKATKALRDWLQDRGLHRVDNDLLGGAQYSFAECWDQARIDAWFETTEGVEKDPEDGRVDMINVIVNQQLLDMEEMLSAKDADDPVLVTPPPYAGLPFTFGGVVAGAYREEIPKRHLLSRAGLEPPEEEANCVGKCYVIAIPTGDPRFNSGMEDFPSIAAQFPDGAGEENTLKGIILRAVCTGFSPHQESLAERWLELVELSPPHRVHILAATTALEADAVESIEMLVEEFKEGSFDAQFWSALECAQIWKEDQLLDGDPWDPDTWSSQGAVFRDDGVRLWPTPEREAETPEGGDQGQRQRSRSMRGFLISASRSPDRARATPDTRSPPRVPGAESIHEKDGTEDRYDDLLRALKIDPQQKTQGKDEMVTAILNLISQGMQPLATEGKKGHRKLKAVDPAALQQFVNPSDGAQLDPNMPITAHIALVSRSGSHAGRGKPSARNSWWCIACNAERIALVLLAGRTVEDLMRRGAMITDEVIEAIEAMDFGMRSCPFHKGQNCAPIGAPVVCEVCHKSQVTSRYGVTLNCEQCGSPFNRLPTDRDKRRNADEAEMSDLSTYKKAEKRLSQQKYHLIREGGGPNALENVGIICSDLTAVRMGINENRGKELGSGIRWCSEPTARKIHFLTTGTFEDSKGVGKNGLVLWDGLPSQASVMLGLEPLPLSALEQAAARASRGEDLPKSPFTAADLVKRPEAVIQTMLNCYRNLLQDLVTVGGQEYDKDVEVACRTMEIEFRSLDNLLVYQEPQMVWRTLSTLLHCYSARLKKQCMSPHISYLFAHEAYSGGYIRFLPVLGEAALLKEVQNAIHKASMISVGPELRQLKEIPGLTKAPQGMDSGAMKPHGARPEKAESRKDVRKKGGSPKPKGPVVTLPQPKGSVSKKASDQTRKPPAGSKEEGDQFKLEVGSGNYGEGKVQPLEKRMNAAPFHDGVRICLDDQTQRGCLNQHCVYKHGVDTPLDIWTAEDHKYMITLGGHKKMEGCITGRQMHAILTTEQSSSAQALHAEARKDMYMFYLYRALSHVAEPTGEPLSSSQFTPYQTRCCNSMWPLVVGQQPPLGIGSRSGIPTVQVNRVAIGCKKACLSGIEEDVGERIVVDVDGAVITKMCVIKAVAASLPHSKRWNVVSWRGARDRVLLLQVFGQLLKIAVEDVTPGSVLAFLYAMAAEASSSGMSEDIYALCHPEELDSYTVLTVREVVPGANSIPHYTFNMVPGGVPDAPEEVYRTPEEATHLVKRVWSPKAQSSQVLIITIKPEMDAEGLVVLTRHAYAMRLARKESSFPKLMARVAKYAREGKAEVTIQARGSPKAEAMFNKAESRSDLGSTAEKLMVARKRMVVMGGILGLDADGEELGIASNGQVEYGLFAPTPQDQAPAYPEEDERLLSSENEAAQSVTNQVAKPEEASSEAREESTGDESESTGVEDHLRLYPGFGWASADFPPAMATTGAPNGQGQRCGARAYLASDAIQMAVKYYATDEILRPHLGKASQDAERGRKAMSDAVAKSCSWAPEQTMAHLQEACRTQLSLWMAHKVAAAGLSMRGNAGDNLADRVEAIGVWAEAGKEKVVSGIVTLWFEKPLEPAGFLTNGFKSTLVVGEDSFSSMEHYIAMRKAEVSGDTNAAKLVNLIDDPAQHAQLSQMLFSDESEVWASMEKEVMMNGLRSKFSPGSDTAERLLATKDKYLMHGTSAMPEQRYPRAREWYGVATKGIRGNVLGEWLMTVRQELADYEKGGAQRDDSGNDGDEEFECEFCHQHFPRLSQAVKHEEQCALNLIGHGHGREGVEQSGQDEEAPHGDREEGDSPNSVLEHHLLTDKLPLTSEDQKAPAGEKISPEMSEEAVRLLMLCREATTHADFLALWDETFKPLLVAAEELPAEKVRERTVILSHVGRFFNSWLKVSAGIWTEQGQSAAGGKKPQGSRGKHFGRKVRAGLLQMVAEFRNHYFGGQASALPPVADILKVFGAHLSAGHRQLLIDLIEKGADPVYLWDPHNTTRVTVSPPRTDAEMVELLKEAVTEGVALRAFVFYTDDWEARELLQAAGVHTSSVVLEPKTDDDGKPRMDEAGRAVLRLCVNCSDGEDAVNEGIWSDCHTMQKTTSAEVVARNFIREDMRYPHLPKLVTKADIATAFKLIGNTLDSIGLFAFTAGPITVLHLTMIFGSKSSPGCFEPTGDTIIQTLISTPRIGRSLTGDTHPPVARFCDDLLSIFAMYGERGNDHCGRVRRLIIAMYGELGLNAAKELEVGQPSTMQHAFGVVLDTAKRVMGSPWSKIVKLHDLVRDFVNRKEEGMNYEKLMSVHGLANHVLQCAPGLHRLLMPRLQAGLASAATKHPGDFKRIPGNTIPNFNLRGETPGEGLLMLRRALRVVLFLAAIKKGRLFRVTPEMMLPLSERKSWPGREGPEDEVKFQMDASGQGLFLLDHATGGYVQTSLTPEEAALFNDFEKGEQATNINHWELASEVFGMVLLAWRHPRKIITMYNDNTAAQNWTNHSGHRIARVDQVLSIIGIMEMCLRVTAAGSRVTTEANTVADSGTREDLAQVHEECMKGLEAQHGWVRNHVLIPADFRDMGMGSTSEEGKGSIGDWYDKAIWAVKYIESQKPGIVYDNTEVRGDEVVEALIHARDGDLLPDCFISNGDLETEKRSEERKALVSKIEPTQTMQRRQLAKLADRFGDEEGGRRFNAANRVDEDADPMVTIEANLQKQHARAYATLYVPNRNHKPGAVVEWPEEGEAPRFQLPANHRLVFSPAIMELYAGMMPISEAARVAGMGHTTVAAENEPAMRANNKERFPEAEHVKQVESVSTRWWKGRQEVVSASPPCVSFSQANTKAQGPKDSMGQPYMEMGRMVMELEPCVAHVENVIQVAENWGAGAGKSPMSQLQDKAQSYYWVPIKVDAGRVVSPFTGEQPAIKHVRLHLFGFHKGCFEAAPMLSSPAAPVVKEALSRLQPDETIHGLRCMPITDQRNLQYRYHQAQSQGYPGAAYVATIDDPDEKGRGHHNFLSEVVDLGRGRSPPWTSTGGPVWAFRDYNGTGQPTLATIIEGCRLYGTGPHRGFRKEWLEGNSYRGMSTLGNMVPPPVGDWVWREILMALTLVQSDGQTAQEKWHYKYKVVPRGSAKQPGDLAGGIFDKVADAPVGVRRSGHQVRPGQDGGAERRQADSGWTDGAAGGSEPVGWGNTVSAEANQRQRNVPQVSRGWGSSGERDESARRHAQGPVCDHAHCGWDCSRADNSAKEPRQVQARRYQMAGSTPRYHGRPGEKPGRRGTAEKPGHTSLEPLRVGTVGYMIEQYGLNQNGERLSTAAEMPGWRGTRLATVVLSQSLDTSGSGGDWGPAWAAPDLARLRYLTLRQRTTTVAVHPLWQVMGDLICHIEDLVQEDLGISLSPGSWLLVKDGLVVGHSAPIEIAAGGEFTIVPLSEPNLQGRIAEVAGAKREFGRAQGPQVARVEGQPKSPDDRRWVRRATTVEDSPRRKHRRKKSGRAEKSRPRQGAETPQVTIQLTGTPGQKMTVSHQVGALTAQTTIRFERIPAGAKPGTTPRPGSWPPCRAGDFSYDSERDLGDSRGTRYLEEQSVRKPREPKTMESLVEEAMELDFSVTSGLCDPAQVATKKACEFKVPKGEGAGVRKIPERSTPALAHKVRQFEEGLMKANAEVEEAAREWKRTASQKLTQASDAAHRRQMVNEELIIAEMRVWALVTVPPVREACERQASHVQPGSGSEGKDGLVSLSPIWDGPHGLSSETCQERLIQWTRRFMDQAPPPLGWSMGASESVSKAWREMGIALLRWFKQLGKHGNSAKAYWQACKEQARTEAKAAKTLVSLKGKVQTAKEKLRGAGKALEYRRHGDGDGSENSGGMSGPEDEEFDFSRTVRSQVLRQMATQERAMAAVLLLAAEASECKAEDSRMAGPKAAASRTHSEHWNQGPIGAAIWRMDAITRRQLEVCVRESHKERKYFGSRRDPQDLEKVTPRLLRELAGAKDDRVVPKKDKESRTEEVQGNTEWLTHLALLFEPESEVEPGGGASLTQDKLVMVANELKRLTVSVGGDRRAEPHSPDHDQGASWSPSPGPRREKDRVWHGGNVSWPQTGGEVSRGDSPSMVPGEAPRAPKRQRKMPPGTWTQADEDLPEVQERMALISARPLRRCSEAVLMEYKSRAVAHWDIDRINVVLAEEAHRIASRAQYVLGAGRGPAPGQPSALVAMENTGEQPGARQRYDAKNFAGSRPPQGAMGSFTEGEVHAEDSDEEPGHHWSGEGMQWRADSQEGAAEHAVGGWVALTTRRRLRICNISSPMSYGSDDLKMVVSVAGRNSGESEAEDHVMATPEEVHANPALRWPGGPTPDWTVRAQEVTRTEKGDVWIDIPSDTCYVDLKVEVAPWNRICFGECASGGELGLTNAHLGRARIILCDSEDITTVVRIAICPKDRVVLRSVDEDRPYGVHTTISDHPFPEVNGVWEVEPLSLNGEARSWLGGVGRQINPITLDGGEMGVLPWAKQEVHYTPPAGWRIITFHNTDSDGGNTGLSTKDRAPGYGRAVLRWHVRPHSEVSQVIGTLITIRVPIGRVRQVMIPAGFTSLEIEPEFCRDFMLRGEDVVTSCAQIGARTPGNLILTNLQEGHENVSVKASLQDRKKLVMWRQGPYGSTTGAFGVPATTVSLHTEDWSGVNGDWEMIPLDYMGFEKRQGYGSHPESKRAGKGTAEGDLRRKRRKLQPQASPWAAAGTRPTRWCQNDRWTTAGLASGKRKEPEFTVELENRVWKQVEEGVRGGKTPSTIKNYTRFVDQWMYVCGKKGWSPFVDGLDPREAEYRTLFYLGYEREVHGLKAGTLRQKLSGLRWHHISNLRGNPYTDMTGVIEWLSNMEKVDGPSQPKIPVPIALLKLVALLIREHKPPDGECLIAGLLTGFMFLARSIEYLADDQGVFDPNRSTTWGDVAVSYYPKDGGDRLGAKLLDLIDMVKRLDQIVVVITLTLFSQKNAMETCTRSVVSSGDEDTCVVRALAKHLEVVVSRTDGEAPDPGTAIFTKADGSVLRRSEVSKVLKEAAMAAGVPKAKVASHSLRRGGASAYIAAGASESATRRHGRWTSEAYEAYVFPHADTLRQAQQNLHSTMPHFELK